MGAKETLVPKSTIKYTGTFDFKSLKTVLERFFDDYNYDFSEEIYKDKGKGVLKDTVIEWVCGRDFDDNTKLILKITFELNDYKEVVIDNKRVIEGDLVIKYKAIVERDFNNKWKGAKRLFLRSVYDKFINVKKQEKAAHELKKMTEDFVNEIKKYLKLK